MGGKRIRKKREGGYLSTPQQKKKKGGETKKKKKLRKGINRYTIAQEFEDRFSEFPLTQLYGENRNRRRSWGEKSFMKTKGVGDTNKEHKRECVLTPFS